MANREKVILSTLFPKITSLDPEMLLSSITPGLLSDYTEVGNMLKDKTTGIEIQVLKAPISVPNAWTIPGATSKSLYQVASLPLPVLNAIIQSLLMTAKLHNKGLEGKKGSDGKIHFTAPPGFKIMMTVTTGLTDLLSEEEVLAVCLHEIGHWVGYKPLFPHNTIFAVMALAAIVSLKLEFDYSRGKKEREPMPELITNLKHKIRKFVPEGHMKKIDALTPKTAILYGLCTSLFYISNFYSQAGEWNADNFVKDVGYNDPLRSGLKRITAKYRGVPVAKDQEIATKDLLDEADELRSLIDKFIPLRAHPAIKRRLANLESVAVGQQDRPPGITDEDMELLASIKEETIYKVINKISDTLTRVDAKAAKAIPIIGYPG